MSFTKTRAETNSFSGASTAEYQLQYLSAELKTTLESFGNRYTEHLTEDIIARKLEIDLAAWLTREYYNPSNEFAKDCLEISPYVSHLFGRKVKPWVESALKCYDNFLLKYIQVDLGETISNRAKWSKETDAYEHLVNKTNPNDIIIGESLKQVYQIRSEMTHVQIVNENGFRIARNISKKKFNIYRDTVILLLRTTLRTLIDKINKNRDNATNT